MVSHGCRRGRGAAAILASLFALWLWHGHLATSALPGVGGGGTARTETALEKAQDVIADAALEDFQHELPHRWQRIGDYFLRPLSRPLRHAGSSPWALLRTDKALQGSGLVKIQGASSSTLLAWLQEVCRVLGVEEETSPHIRCPELWIDQSWPPSPVTPRSKRSAPVWTFPTRVSDRDVVVVQMSLVKDFTPKETKALLGFEVGRLVLKRLPALVPPGLGDPLAYGFLALRTYKALRQVTEPPRALAGASPWIRTMLSGHARWWTRPYAPGGTTAEFEALGRIVRRLVPGPLQPPMFAGLMVNGEEIENALHSGRQRAPLKLHLRGSQQPQPFRGLAGNALALGMLRLFSGSRGRSYVLTLDRAAALAAGDATASASALLRAHRLLPPHSQQTDLRRTLGSVAESAHEKLWAYRQEALFQNPREPPPAVRVAELMTWSQTDQAKRLLALAEVRRNRRGPSWLEMCQAQTLTWKREVWKPSMGYAALGLLLIIPFVTPIDAVRWASWCSMSLTLFGLVLPLLQFIGAPALPMVPLSSLWISLALYSLIAGSIWWNHLLGGARRWAVLSGQLASQLVDQADAATGIAFLTRDWAEMARRSLAALDQELCGSWRTSLHELASKLADLKQELEEPALPSNGAQKSLRDGYTSVEAEDDYGMPQKQLAAWAGRMEAAVGRPTARQPLWLKVDRAVQRTARVESARMRCALEASDPDQLQAMMTWWMARDSSAASSGGIATARLLQEDCSNEEDGEAETLGALLFSERLHRRFPYTSFYGKDDVAVGSSVSEAAAPGVEFERLQQALQQNLEALQDLRSKLAPYQDSSRSALMWRWSDVVSVASRFREALRLPSKAKRALAVVPAAAAAGDGVALTRRFSDVDLSDNIAEFTTISGLFLAAVLGLLGFGAAAAWHHVGWAAGLFAFGAANSVLLRNYSRLHLPHVRRRLEHRLKELSQQKDALLKDVQHVQHASRKTGMVQVRAHIFLQSVNVIRNIDYLTRCIKTEVQRLASDRNPRSVQLRRRFASSGLQLLLALLPHSPPQWQQEALGGENCAELASMLYARRRGLAAPVAADVLSSGYVDSRKRLWLLFRMVHLSSAIPTEVQGKLTALVDSYLRPVLVERRVPTGYAGALDGAASTKAMLEDGTGQPGEDDEDKDLEQHVSTKGVSASSAARSSADSEERADSEDALSFCASTTSQSKLSATSCDRVGDTSKAVRKLFATRGDIAQVLKRLPAQALLSPQGSTTQTDTILRDIFTSVAVAVPASLLGEKGEKNGKGGPGHVVGLATGYQYSERPYSVSRAQTTLDLKVAVPSGGSPQELSVQLCHLSDAEPSALEALSAWSDLAAALPLRFNDSALRVRRRHLKKAKEALRALPR